MFRNLLKKAFIEKSKGIWGPIFRIFVYITPVTIFFLRKELNAYNTIIQYLCISWNKLIRDWNCNIKDLYILYALIFIYVIIFITLIIIFLNKIKNKSKIHEGEDLINKDNIILFEDVVIEYLGKLIKSDTQSFQLENLSVVFGIKKIYIKNNNMMDIEFNANYQGKSFDKKVCYYIPENLIPEDMILNLYKEFVTDSTKDLYLFTNNITISNSIKLLGDKKSGIYNSVVGKIVQYHQVQSISDLNGNFSSKFQSFVGKINIQEKVYIKSDIKKEATSIYKLFIASNRYEKIFCEGYNKFKKVLNKKDINIDKIYLTNLLK